MDFMHIDFHLTLQARWKSICSKPKQVFDINLAINFLHLWVCMVRTTPQNLGSLTLLKFGQYGCRDSTGYLPSQSKTPSKVPARTPTTAGKSSRQSAVLTGTPEKKRLKVERDRKQLNSMSMSMTKNKGKIRSKGTQKGIN